MKKVLFILLIIQLCNSFKINIFDKPLKDKLPSYLGKGYHLLKGNPFTNKIDEGFKAPIFDFSYKQNLSTDDGKYLIPDHTYSVESVSCSLQAKCNSYTGTSKYQQELQKIAKFDTRLNASFLDAAYTFSIAFNEFSSFSIARNQTVSHAKAECSIYTVEMPLYTNEINLTEDFSEGVKEAYKKKDWKNFISHFGTHYTNKVIFGGRYVYQHTYSQQTMSFFQSMGLDINKGASVQFANKFQIGASQETKKYQNQTRIINLKVQNEIQSMIGGEPPINGTWVDWQRTVRDNLAPIGYQITSLSVLFNFIKVIQFQVKEAIKSYEFFLNAYCQNQKCPIIEPERPPPKPLNVSFHREKQISGKKCSSQTFDTLDEGVKIGMRVVKVLMGSQGSIDSVQFFLSDGLSEHDLEAVGDRQFNHEYTVPKNDQIRCIRFGITYNEPYWKFTSMQFVTKNESVSDTYGGYFRINQYQVICLQNSDDHFVGFYGKYGSTFDAIGFNIMKETFEK